MGDDSVSERGALIPAPGTEERLALAVAAWIDSKAKRSGSHRTPAINATTLRSFRQALQSAGLELDGDDRAVALLAQAWSAHRVPRSGNQLVPVTPPAASTINQRLAIVSSFHAYAIRLVAA